MWDSDQGHDMLVLLSFVRNGSVPLLGPPTSIGDFHHGALYYFLLVPAAAISGVDPVAVTATIALGGVAATAVVWWLARSIGGAVAGLVAAALMAVSASAIEGSTFIWNPNVLPLFSGIGVAAAWHAFAARRPRWWIVAAAGQAIAMQSHVLAAILLAPLGALFVVDLRRRVGVDRRELLRAGLLCLGVFFVAYLPLLAHELQHGFSETRAAARFLTGGDASPDANDGRNLGLSLVIVALRASSWPLTGLITAAPVAAILASAAVIAACVVSVRRGRQREREAVRWLLGGLVWSVLALVVVAPSLSNVVPGLPNDHYHAFLDPIVVVLVGLGFAALWRWGRVAPALAGSAVAALLAFNVFTWPPAVAWDGGWPAAERAANRIVAALGDRRYALVGVPDFKPTDAFGFPLTRLGRPPAAIGNATRSVGASALVIPCDRLFEGVVGLACGGPAEDAEMARIDPGWRLADRFDASARTSISIYVMP